MVTHLLAPRPDVLAGRVQGVIDLDRVNDPKKRALESKPLEFAQATYVSSDVRLLVTTIHKRLNGTQAETGTILLEGPKGQGKSHLVTLAFHILSNTSQLAGWLKENGLELNLPERLVIVWRKFTDFPLDSVWQLIGEELGMQFPTERPPSLTEFRAALKGRKLVLLFDELESGIRAIRDDALQQQNINFLQMISEESSREDSNVLLVASIYDGGIEPGLTLKRVNRAEIRFSDPTDRLRILFHRLFTKPPQPDSPEIAAIVKSYVNTWRRFGIPAGSDYEDRFRETFPFAPELLEVVMQRIPQSRGGFQGTRGSLSFLATLVRLRGTQTNVLTLSDVVLSDAEIRTWLADLEPSQNLISCAEANLRELKALPLSDRIASAVLISSLAPSSRYPGVSEEELARQVIDPGADYNQFRQTVGGFVQYASYFHKRDNSLYFDTKENAHAKVELRSLSINEADAWDRASDWWRKDLFGDPEAVILSDIDSSRPRLDAIQGENLRFAIAPRRLNAEERHALFFGLKRRNTVILLEPRDDKTNLRTHKDLLAWARKAIAADALAQTAGDAARAGEFAKIAGDHKRAVLDAIKKVNYAFVQVHLYGATAKESEFSLEPVPNMAKEMVLQHLSRNVFPEALLAEHIQDRAAELFGRKVSSVEAEYRNTVGFPVIVHQSTFQEAILGLVEDGVFNLNHPSGTQHAGERPTLSGHDLAEAFLAEPSERAAAPAHSRAHPPSATPSSGTATADNGGSDASPLPLDLGEEDEQIATPFLDSRQRLRQEVAAKLEQHADRTARQVRIGITYDRRDAEMSSLPALVRGSLSGSGQFSGEISLEFRGTFTKAQVEDMVERLPDFTPGSAQVRLVLSS